MTATTGANDQPYRATKLLIKIGPSTLPELQPLHDQAIDGDHLGP